MAERRQFRDTVRPSRDGHEFHEAWTARKAMQLLLPRDGLVGIAVEGLSETDQSGASPGTVEVADLTVYYGEDASFSAADRVETLQFKYSPTGSDAPFRAAHAKKTVIKFAESYRDHRTRYGTDSVAEKLSFELVTNRPILPALSEAIEGIAKGCRLTRVAKRQAEQFERASNLTGKPLREFAGKCRITGLAGNLSKLNKDLSTVLVDWSATTDPLARARLGNMRRLVRSKASCDAQFQKVIRQVDVLAALEVSDVEDLLPCPSSLANLGEVVPREQLEEIVNLVPSLNRPLLVHAAGGVGKTVFLDSLASLMESQHEVVFFDCFGGGAYRAPEDARHLPRRGLVHLTNVLACRGLCDPILPGSDSREALFRTFRKRLTQCISTLSTASEESNLIVFIDAIDNAAYHAEDRKEDSFPKLLLESFHHMGPVPGVKLVVSCRSHRIEQSVGGTRYESFELPTFGLTETTSYLRARLPDVTDTEIQVAQARSAGNARILEHFVSSNRSLLDSSEIHQSIELDDLLKNRIEGALDEAKNRGSSKEEINAFLAGLSVLPPPVPVEEYAHAHDMDIGAIQSFAADLAPLLERTQHGLTFRDEPTESLVREQYGSNKFAIDQVASRLLARQETSLYAAQALPALLLKLNEGEKLFDLALSDRFPHAVTTIVGRRRILYARLKAAVLHAASIGESNRLVRLLVELSTITASDQNGTGFIFDHPDLVVNSRDVDAIRRLFDARLGWRGARHARLTIANVLDGDLENAARYYVNTVNWIRHDRENADQREFDFARPEKLDHTAIPFYLVVQGQPERAIDFMQALLPSYGYEISEILFDLLQQSIQRIPHYQALLDDFLDELSSEIGCLAGALSFLELDDVKRRSLIQKLGKTCKREKKEGARSILKQESSRKLSDGLCKAAAIAVSLGLTEEALQISLRSPHDRPSIWSMADKHSPGEIFSFLVALALESATTGSKLHEKDILPSELIPFAKGISKTLTTHEYKRQLKQKLEKQWKKERNAKKPGNLTGEERRRHTDLLLNYRIGPLFELTNALAVLLGSPLGEADRSFQKLVDVCAKVRKLEEGHHFQQQINHFFQLLGHSIVLFALWARSDLETASVETLLRHLHELDYLNPSTLIEVIAIISARSRDNSRFDLIAGEEAVKAKALIELDDNVSTRASSYGELAKAILPVSRSDAGAYFSFGLKQFDAIGSGDYEFTNELLLFASSVRGSELSDKDVHTFTNICELNMSYEAAKFPWGDFGTAMSRTAGLRGLAKLSRWHDRGTIGLNYTLLPYLTALLRDKKIAPEDALALNRLASPEELWVCNTEAFANNLLQARLPDARKIVVELIQQYEDNNPSTPITSILNTLAAIASDVLGEGHTTTKYLLSAYQRYEDVHHEQNERRNVRPSSENRTSRPHKEDEDRSREEAIRTLATATDSLEEVSLSQAIGRMSEMQCSRELERLFFHQLRRTVRLGDRSKYVSLVGGLESLDIYAKLGELAECKTVWASSSADLDVTFSTLVQPILDIHFDEFLVFDQLSRNRMNEVSSLTGVSLLALTLQLVEHLVKRDETVPAAAWLGLASLICKDVDEGEGQKALERLLNSDSAALTSTVLDGPWTDTLSPANDISTIACGMIWQALGAPNARDRWQAAYSIRCFARFDRWQFIDALVEKLGSKESTCFQALELPFFALHAKLWLPMTLARLALDYPERITKYAQPLKKIALDSASPHVVMRHFAAETILACEGSGVLHLSAAQKKKLKTINESPFPSVDEGSRNIPYIDFYTGRPRGEPEPEFEYRLDYDFEKYEVAGLARVFGQNGWKMRDRISEQVHKVDPNASSMYDTAGRESPVNRRSSGLNPNLHAYGEYLAWHALRVVAAQLLEKLPVAEESIYEEPWSAWLNRKLLTRRDGLWLSDGMDRPPLQIMHNLLERGENDLVLTGDQEKLTRLVGIDTNALAGQIVVAGDWVSPDGVGVHVTSALAPRSKATQLANQLVNEDPFQVWLANDNYNDEESGLSGMREYEYVPWIFAPYPESNELDEHDPLSVIAVAQRPCFREHLVKTFCLKPDDPFGRSWSSSLGKIVATTEAWGYSGTHDNNSDAGARLACKSDFLSEVLDWSSSDLLLLIKLRRYVEAIGVRGNGRFFHTIAVLRIEKNLAVEYFAGTANHLDEPSF